MVEVEMVDTLCPSFKEKINSTEITSLKILKEILTFLQNKKKILNSFISFNLFLVFYFLDQIEFFFKLVVY